METTIKPLSAKALAAGGVQSFKQPSGEIGELYLHQSGKFYVIEFTLVTGKRTDATFHFIANARKAVLALGAEWVAN